MSDCIIETRGLTKRYGDQVSVSNLDLHVNCTQENGHNGFDPRPRLVDTHLTHRVRGTSSVIK